ncbi:amino acid ABC transporter permease [Falsiroseomonas stagni]|uniref:Polar amino acid transport system permease protein n=1 Tax=Falsiroseomonas stagni DSM 19981 TaxID=1123062 RepID=A0A1I4A6G0_9PROT|nr:amino acid ABC transporter permease [Falsiroseomonas stagni]SFK52002.1 polar amino acid transport system permease protein [Falsiroseomonas stagni DSM 19981]
MDFIAEALPPMLWAAGNTVWISAVGIALGLVLGVPIAVGCEARRAWALTYVSFFRGVPLLIQLMLAYYALPFLGIDLPAWFAATATLGLCCAAYMAEIIRGGFALVQKGGLEAARLLGLTPRQILLRIRLPIALQAMRPAVINEAILIVKASSLISVVGILELTRSAQAIASSTFEPLPAYALCGAIYLAMNLLLMMFARGRPA